MVFIGDCWKVLWFWNWIFKIIGFGYVWLFFDMWIVWIFDFFKLSIDVGNYLLVYE